MTFTLVDTAYLFGFFLGALAGAFGAWVMLRSMRADIDRMHRELERITR